MKLHVLIKVFLFLYILQNGNCNSQSSKIDIDLLPKLEKGEHINIFLTMKEGADAVLKTFGLCDNFSSRTERVNAVTKALKSQSENSQKSVIQFLETNSINYKIFWISNQIYIPQASLSLVEKLSALPEVSEIVEEAVVQLEKPTHELHDEIQTDINAETVQWGVNKIQADQVWNHNTSQTTGEGIVVGGIDTGVRSTHQDLRHNFRSHYGWRDPISGSQIPYDDNGHGTHTMGTIVGGNGIGVAPGAQWIACRACSNDGCMGSHLLECGQFMLCPTLPNGGSSDCSKSPHLVSNSWGGDGGRTFYNHVTNAWIAAGIIPFFSIGNSGPACGTAGSPGDQNVIAVGATTSNDSLAIFSSRGGVNSNLKPDISAPGHLILSASNVSDTHYRTISGTSMACPHAAGTGALLMALRNDISYAKMKSLLFAGVDNEDLIPPVLNCGNSNSSQFPNNAFGQGRINAYKSVNALLASSSVVTSINVLMLCKAILITTLVQRFSF